MPRTIDKLRAKLPGGKIGAYSITTAFGPGLSLMLLDDIGVTEKCLLEIVQKVSVEHEIADWLRKNADLSSVASLNEKLFSPRIEDVLAFIPVATFKLIYPAKPCLKELPPIWFSLIVASEKSLQEIGDRCVKVVKISGLAQGFWRDRDKLGTRNELRNGCGI